MEEDVWCCPDARRRCGWVRRRWGMCAEIQGVREANGRWIPARFREIVIMVMAVCSFLMFASAHIIRKNAVVRFFFCVRAVCEMLEVSPVAQVLCCLGCLEPRCLYLAALRAVEHVQRVVRARGSQGSTCGINVRTDGRSMDISDEVGHRDRCPEVLWACKVAPLITERAQGLRRFWDMSADVCRSEATAADVRPE